MANDGFKNGALSGTLTADDNNAGKFERIALVYAQQHTSDFDQFSRQVHESVLPQIGILTVGL
jgi:hypothetical protein